MTEGRLPDFPSNAHFASQANAAKMVQNMAEALFGEDIHAGAKARLEKHLLNGKTLTPKEMETPEFKHRAREAMHALMCLPEYQLS